MAKEDKTGAGFYGFLMVLFKHLKIFIAVVTLCLLATVLFVGRKFLAQGKFETVQIVYSLSGLTDVYSRAGFEMGQFLFDSQYLDNPQGFFNSDIFWNQFPVEKGKSSEEKERFIKKNFNLSILRGSALKNSEAKEQLKDTYVAFLTFPKAKKQNFYALTKYLSLLEKYYEREIRGLLTKYQNIIRVERDAVLAEVEKNIIPQQQAVRPERPSQDTKSDTNLFVFSDRIGYHYPVQVSNLRVFNARYPKLLEEYESIQPFLKLDSDQLMKHLEFQKEYTVEKPSQTKLLILLVMGVIASLIAGAVVAVLIDFIHDFNDYRRNG